MILSLVVACAVDNADTGVSFDYPLDDVLRFNHLQAVGTHNSYHMRTPGLEVDAWDYEHAPLDEQLGSQGVRQFELDIWYDGNGGFDVFHVPAVDATSTCATLRDCLDTMRQWSDDNPAHHPLYTLLEVKDEFDAADPGDLLDALETEVDASWPEDRRVSPSDVQGDHATLAEAVAEGWPTLGALRGQALFVLHAGDDYRQLYTDGDTTTEGRVLFPDAYGDTSLPIAATSSMNDPWDTEGIASALAAGHLVRTRADSDGDQARANDMSDRDQAFAVGAHFVSSDFPVPHEDTGYVVAVPGGTPSGCNPVTAPSECSPEAIENPEFIGE